MKYCVKYLIYPNTLIHFLETIKSLRLLATRYYVSLNLQEYQIFAYSTNDNFCTNIEVDL